MGKRVILDSGRRQRRIHEASLDIVIVDVSAGARIEDIQDFREVVLREIARLKKRLPSESSSSDHGLSLMLQRFLEESTSYAECVEADVAEVAWEPNKTSSDLLIPPPRRLRRVASVPKALSSPGHPWWPRHSKTFGLDYPPSFVQVKGFPFA